MDAEQVSGILTTRGGYMRLQARLQAALNAYNAVCDTNAHAAGDGDNSVWHDNFAYEHNQREMHRYARRITDLQKLLAAARVVELPSTPNTVQLGCIVVLRDEIDNTEWRFEIAGYEDGDVACGRISYTTPLMQKIIGGKTGDAYELFLDGHDRIIIIAAIRRTEESKQ